MLYIFGHTAQHYLNVLQTSGEVRPFPDSMLLFLFVAASVVCIYFVFMATFCVVSSFVFVFFTFRDGGTHGTQSALFAHGTRLAE